MKTWCTLLVLLIGSLGNALVHAQVISVEAKHSIGAIAFANNSPDRDVDSSEITNINPATGNPAARASAGKTVIATSDFSVGAATGLANATYGKAGVFLSLIAENRSQPPFFGFGDGSGWASARWEDKTQIQSPEVPLGQHVIMRTVLQADLESFTFEGSTSGENSIARMSLIINDLTDDGALPDSPYGGNVWGTYERSGFLGGSELINYPPALIFLEHEMVVGSFYTMGFEVRIEGSITADIPGSADVRGDFSNSLTWGGILSVRDAITGEEIHDWTITSLSGFDYSRPYSVPEPAGHLFSLVPALISLILVRRLKAGRNIG